MESGVHFNIMTNYSLSDEFIAQKNSKRTNHFPHLTCNKIGNNSFSFSRKKFRIKRKYISQTQLSQTKSQHNDYHNKPPLAHKAADQYIPGKNNQLYSTAKNIKVFPRSTYNFLSNIQRFEYQNGAKEKAEIGPGKYHTEGNKIPNANTCFHKKLIDYHNKKKREKKIKDKQSESNMNDGDKNRNSYLITDTVIIISDKRPNSKRPKSESGLKVNEQHKEFGKFLSKVNKEVFEVLPAREIVSVFVSKSQKGFPSMKNHVPGPTYYNPKELRHKSYYANTKKIWF